ncbi:MAG: NYN domain-containing protein [Siphonobacter sp.]
MANDQLSLTRIGVFYDGNYFLHVSNYYNYFHSRKSRISVSGLHSFIKHQVAEEEGLDTRSCQIVDAHYFRGRLSAQEASQRGNMLFYDRVFDDLLMTEGVTTHYLPIRSTFGSRHEKGIDVWLALEAYELTLYKKFDVLVLIASDGDFVPLVRKLNTLGTRVMVLSWDFEYTTEDGQKMVTRTSQDLLQEATYYSDMQNVIEDRGRRNDSLVTDLFVQPPTPPQATPRPERSIPGFTVAATNGNVAIDSNTGQDMTSTIYSLKNGYGFIKYPPNNLFFHYTSLVDTDFNELQEGDEVEFTLALNERGDYIAKNVRLLWDEEGIAAPVDNSLGEQPVIAEPDEDSITGNY